MTDQYELQNEIQESVDKFVSATQENLVEFTKDWKKMIKKIIENSDLLEFGWTAMMNCLKEKLKNTSSTVNFVNNEDSSQFSYTQGDVVMDDAPKISAEMKVHFLSIILDLKPQYFQFGFHLRPKKSDPRENGIIPFWILQENNFVLYYFASKLDNNLYKSNFETNVQFVSMCFDNWCKCIKIIKENSSQQHNFSWMYNFHVELVQQYPELLTRFTRIKEQQNENNITSLCIDKLSSLIKDWLMILPEVITSEIPSEEKEKNLYLFLCNSLLDMCDKISLTTRNFTVIRNVYWNCIKLTTKQQTTLLREQCKQNSDSIIIIDRVAQLASSQIQYLLQQNNHSLSTYKIIQAVIQSVLEVVIPFVDVCNFSSYLQLLIDAFQLYLQTAMTQQETNAEDTDFLSEVHTVLCTDIGKSIGEVIKRVDWSSQVAICRAVIAMNVSNTQVLGYIVLLSTIYNMVQIKSSLATDIKPSDLKLLMQLFSKTMLQKLIACIKQCNSQTLFYPVLFDEKLSGLKISSLHSVYDMALYAAERFCASIVHSKLITSLQKYWMELLLSFGDDASFNAKQFASDVLLFIYVIQSEQQRESFGKLLMHCLERLAVNYYGCSPDQASIELYSQQILRCGITPIQKLLERLHLVYHCKYFDVKIAELLDMPLNHWSLESIYFLALIPKSLWSSCLGSKELLPKLQNFLQTTCQHVNLLVDTILIKSKPDSLKEICALCGYLQLLSNLLGIIREYSKGLLSNPGLQNEISDIVRLILQCLESQLQDHMKKNQKAQPIVNNSKQNENNSSFEIWWKIECYTTMLFVLKNCLTEQCQIISLETLLRIYKFGHLYYGKYPPIRFAMIDFIYESSIVAFESSELCNSICEQLSQLFKLILSIELTLHTPSNIDCKEAETNWMLFLFALNAYSKIEETKPNLIYFQNCVPKQSQPLANSILTAEILNDASKRLELIVNSLTSNTSVYKIKKEEIEKEKMRLFGSEFAKQNQSSSKQSNSSLQRIRQAIAICLRELHSTQSIPTQSRNQLLQDVLALQKKVLEVSK